MAKGETINLSDDDIAAANARMDARRESVPYAVAARYDRRIGRVVMTMNTSVELAFAPHLAQGLERARPGDLLDIEINPAGTGIQFPRLDADLYVPALFEGSLGTKHWQSGRARREMQPQRQRKRA